MNLTQVPISMIDTVAGDAGKVLTSNGSTLSWTASASITPSSATTAKAWVNFDGTGAIGAQTIRSSHNISSVVKTATGTYTVNFTTPMADANYVPIVTGNLATNAQGDSSVSGSSITTSSCQIRIAWQGGTYDTPYVMLVVFGN